LTVSFRENERVPLFVLGGELRRALASSELELHPAPVNLDDQPALWSPRGRPTGLLIESQAAFHDALATLTSNQIKEIDRVAPYTNQLGEATLDFQSRAESATIIEWLRAGHPGVLVL